MSARPFALLRQYPARATLLLGALFAAMAAGVPRLQSKMDPYADGGSNASAQRWLALEEKEFRDAHGVLLLLTREDRSWTARELCGIERWAENWARTDGGVRSWLSPLRIRHARRDGDRLLFPRAIGWNCHAPETLSDAPWDEDFCKIDAPPWSNYLAGTPHEYGLQLTFDDTKTPAGDYSYDDVRRVYRAFSAYVQKEHPTARVLLAGPSAFSFFLEEVLVQDAWVSLLLFGVLALLLRAFLGTWRSSFVYAGSLLLTFAGLFGVMGWMGLPINVLTQSLALMTAIAGIEDFIFISAARANGLEHGEEFAHVAIPGFWTTLTTAVGFWSLGVSDVAIIRDFGLAAGFGALLEWAVLFLILPALTKLVPILDGWVRADKAWIKIRVGAFGFRAPRIAWAIALGGIVAGFVAFNFVVYDENPNRNFPPAHPQAQAGKFLEERRGWTGQIDLLFPLSETGKQIAAPEIAALLTLVARVPGVKQVHDEEDFLRYFTAGLNERDALLARQELSGSPLQETYLSRTGVRRAFLMTEPQSVAGLKTLVRDLRELCRLPDCALSGKAVSYLDITDDVVDTLLKSFLTSLFWVSVLVLGLAWLYRSGSYPQLILSALWGPFVMIAIVGVFKIEMNLITCLFAAVIVGLSGDNAIHYVFASRGRDLREGTLGLGAASIILALTLAICSLTMVAQTLRPLNILGGLLSLAFLISLFGEFSLFTALLGEPEAPAPAEKTHREENLINHH